MSLLTLKKPLRIMPAMPQTAASSEHPADARRARAAARHRRALRRERRDTLVPPLVLDELRDQADAVVARAGVDPVYRDYVGVLVNNEVWSEQLASVPFDRRLLLLPKCLRVEDKCPAPFDEFGLLCKQCGLCTIQDLQEEAERLGYAVLVAEGSALVMALIQSGKIDAIVGVSCLSVLERAFPYMEAAAIPGVAIPLLQDDCKDTAVDIDWVWNVIHLTSDDRTRRLDLDALRTEVETLVRARRARRRARTGGRRGRSRRQKLAGRRGQTVAAVSDGVRVQGAAGRSGTAAPGIAAQGRGRRRVLSQGLARPRRHRGRRRATLRTGHPARRTRRAGRPQRRRSAARRRATDCSPAAAPRATCARSWSGSPPPDIASSASDRARSSPGCDGREPLSADQALDIFRRKTSPAFQVALGIGAALAGATADTQQVLRDYSEALGIAYQIRDDLEDLADTEPVDGSGLGGPSLLLALACDKAKAAGRDRVMTLFVAPAPRVTGRR